MVSSSGRIASPGPGRSRLGVLAVAAVWKWRFGGMATRVSGLWRRCGCRAPDSYRKVPRMRMPIRKRVNQFELVKIKQVSFPDGLHCTVERAKGRRFSPVLGPSGLRTDEVTPACGMANQDFHHPSESGASLQPAFGPRKRAPSQPFRTLNV